MEEKSTSGILVAAVVWIIIIAVLAVAAKFLILPYFQKELETQTGSESRYKHEINLAADSFSGYAVFRSPAIQKDLKNQGIKLNIVDDTADYAKRIRALKQRDVQMAVFTVDSLITAGAMIKNYPASIVMVIDETKGADAIVAYKNAVPGLQDLDNKDARIVLTPNSPSEFLCRTVIAHFNLPNLPEKWEIEADGAADVYKQFVTADTQKKWGYALWEPYVSKALKEKGAHLLIDSSKLKGYIVDVLVAERNFLIEHPELVKAVIEAYFRALFNYSQKSDGMETLVMDDATATGSEKLNKELAGKLVKGIEWKNTLENYAYLGVVSKDGTSQYLEDMIINITDVLIKTGSLTEDPLQGKANTLFHNKILKELKAENFHPGKKINIIKDLGQGTADLDQIRTSAQLGALSDQEWESLIPVGQMRVQPIAFARGTARINIQSKRDLDQLARNLKGWPSFYLKVIGHTRKEGDPKANRILAGKRAQAALAHLLAAGIDKNRIKSMAAEPMGSGGASQSVAFTLCQKPY